MTRALPIWTPCANFLLRSIKLCGLRRLAVFCHGAARDVDALRLQPLGKHLVGQGSVLILLLHKHGDGLLCHDAGDLTACQLCGKQAAQQADALRRLDILPAERAADGGGVQADGLRGSCRFRIS